MCSYKPDTHEHTRGSMNNMLVQEPIYFSAAMYDSNMLAAIVVTDLHELKLV